MSVLHANFPVPTFVDLARSDFLADVLGAVTLEELATFLDVLLKVGETDYVFDLLAQWVYLDGDAELRHEGDHVVVVTGGGSVVRIATNGRRKARGGDCEHPS